MDLNTNEFLATRMSIVCAYSELLSNETYGALTMDQRRVLFAVVAAAREMVEVMKVEYAHPEGRPYMAMDQTSSLGRKASSSPP
jgi:hypothetical protein